MQQVLDPGQIEAFATQRVIPRVRLPDTASVFRERARRLRYLSEGHAVGDYLRLMAALAQAQQEALQSNVQPQIIRVRDNTMPPLQATGWPRDDAWRMTLLRLCDDIAAAPGFPAPVSAACRRIQHLGAAELDCQADWLLSGDTGIAGIDGQAAPFIMAALQVYWVRMAGTLSLEDVAAHVSVADLPGVCPLCGTLPVASIVRAEKAYQGYRYLQCALCATEWHLVRIKCSHCQSTEGIHYHGIEGGSPAIRAEACDACRTYRKICYQEHDMTVEPLADDLGSVALDLLMTEAGFHRGSGNPLLWQATAS
jgi:FdhE protein